MSKEIALINRLDAIGVQLRLKDGKLTTLAAPGTITQEIGTLIREHRDALLEFLARRMRADELKSGSIPALGAASYEPSHAQRRLWLIEQGGTAGTSYNMPAALYIEGDVDLDAMAAAFSAIVDRHQILRTVYRERDGQPVCEVQPHRAFDLCHVRVAANGPQDEVVRQLMAAECARRFDLERDLMLRATLIELGERRHMLLLNMHHIAADGWSMGILIGEFTRQYEEMRRGTASPLPPLAVQYGDYAVWQHTWLKEGLQERQLDYWKRRLDGVPHLHGLPTDYPRPAQQSFAGAVHLATLGAPETDALRRLCRETGATPFIALQLAFAIVLSRWSNETDIAFGTPVANRVRPELEPLIGFFINTLVIRNRIDPARSFRELLAEATARISEDYDHQNVPFDVLVEALNPARSAAHPPLVQILFALQNNERKEIALEGLRVAPVGLPYDSAKVDLTLNVSEHDGGLVTSWEFCLALFRAETIERMAGHYLTLLDAIGRAPDLPVARLAMLGAAERERLLVQLNDTARPYARTSLLHVFNEQVQRQPGGIALAEGERSLSYGALELRVRALAAWLVRHGVQDEQPVGIYMERGIDMVVAMLAVLQAGGAYVPMDLSMPAERLALVSADAGCTLVLCSEPLRGALADIGALAVAVDTLNLDPQAVPAIPLPEPRDGRRLAYIMYTSGSTGKPKGVMVEQRGILRLVCNPDYLDMDASDVVAQASNSAFDAATFEIWGALLNGACLRFIDSDTLLDPPRLAQALARHAVSVMWMTSSLFNQTVNLQPAIFTGLHAVLFGGEAADVQAVKRVLDAGGPRRLIHIYGPTENTSFTTAFDIIAPMPQGYPIGRPISNTSCYVLGRAGELLPFGAIGELYTGGDGVARGYLNRDELNAQRFLDDPFAQGGTLYRTGDIVRWLPGDQLQYLSRVDNQVKIRGFRVELGDIEQALVTCAEVDEAAVLVLSDEGRGKYLAAYVVPAPGTKADGLAARLKAALTATLPPYMVPSAFVVLPAMPLNANGKTERRSLPVPAPDAFGGTFDEPEGALEHLLARIWCETLRLERVGATVSFFELGGNSLSMMRLCGSIREHTGFEVSFADLISRPSVRQQAAWLADQHTRAAAPPIVRRPPADDYPLSFAQQRLWFESLLGNSASYNLPIALQLDGALDRAALGAALRGVVASHDVLRSQYFSKEGRGCQRIAALGDWKMEQTDLRGDPEPLQACRRAMLAELEHCFDLERGPLFKAFLYQVAEESHVLLLNMHHIVADGWSMRVLFDEVSTLYRRIVAGERDASVAALPLQYTDYACWQREQEQEGDNVHSLNYWVDTLAFVRALPLLPTDRPRYAAAEYPLGTLSSVIPAEVAAAAKRLATDNDASLFMVLLAAYSLVMCAYSRQERVVVGTDIAGREQQQTESLIGLFVNQLALAAELAPGMNFTGLLQSVRERTLAAYRHQHVPVEQVVSTLRLERGLTQHPLFQSKLVLQNFESGLSAAIPGITYQHVELGARRCKLDLMLTLVESAAGLHCEWEFNADYFTQQTVNTLQANLAHVLQSVAEQPDIALDALRADFERFQRERMQGLRGRLAGATRNRPRATSNPTEELHHGR